MSRSILWITLFSVLGVWIYGVQIVRPKIKTAIDGINTENMQIVYRDIKIGGFPFLWRADIEKPRIIITDSESSREIFVDIAYLHFDFVMKSAHLELGKNIHYQVKYGSDNIMNYNIVNDDDISIGMDFNKSSYLFDSSEELIQNIKAIKFNTKQLSFLADQIKVLDMMDVNFNASQITETHLDKFNVKLRSDFQSLPGYFISGNSSLLLDSYFIINRKNSNDAQDLDFDRKIAVSNFDLNLDGASLKLDGGLNLSKDNLPEGQFRVYMEKYKQVIDLLMPENFIISAPFINKIISETSRKDGNIESENVQFDINFSDKGVAIGSLNLLDLQSQ